MDLTSLVFQKACSIRLEGNAKEVAKEGCLKPGLELGVVLPDLVHDLRLLLLGGHLNGCSSWHLLI